MKFIPARYHYSGGNTPRLVVIHDMEFPKQEGAAEWCANFFATSSQDSAHYCIDNQEIVQSVDESDGAWHTPGYLAGVEVNRESIGIEHAGYASQTRDEWLDGYSLPMLQQSARLVADICKRYGIPARHLTLAELAAGESGIAGHVDITRASGSGTHTDPGDGFPWDWYIAQVNADMGGGGLAKSAFSLPFLMSFALVGGAAYFVATTPAAHLRRLLG